MFISMLKKRKYIFFLLGGCVICVILLLVHMSTLLSFQSEQTIDSLKAHNSQNVRYLNEKNKSILKILDLSASFLSVESVLDSPSSVKKIASIAELSTFSKLAIAMPDGMAIFDDTSSIDISGMQSYVDVINGTKPYDVFTQENDIVFSYPISKKDGPISGVLLAFMPKNVINEALKLNCCLNEGNIAISNSLGEIIFTDLPSDSEKIRSIIAASHSYVANTQGRALALPAGHMGYTTPVGSYGLVFTSILPTPNLFSFSLFQSSILIMIGLLVISIVCIVIVHYNLSKRELVAQQERIELKAMADNIIAGVFRCDITERFQIKYASQSALDMLGYTHEDIYGYFGGSLASIMHRTEARMVAAQYQNDLQMSRTSFEYEYRLRCKDSKEIWVQEHSRIAETMDGGKHLFIVLIDVTKSKLALQDKMISEECYRILYNTSEAIVFDYNMLEGKLTLGNRFEKKFGVRLPNNITPKEFYTSELLYPDDSDAFQNTLKSLPMSGESCQSCEIRLKDSSDNFIWCKIEVYGVFGSEGSLARVIGKITDIDNQKREHLLLHEKSTRDPLTGLLNKVSTKLMIEKFLSDDIPNNVHAMMILDVDNFKTINDTYGHPVGDELLLELSKCVRQNLRDSDILGRIGGDEFCFFLKNIQDAESAQRVADILRKKISELPCSSMYKFSVSIGLSMYPSDARTHDKLYELADRALYESKESGKNKATLYSFGNLEGEHKDKRNNDR